MATTTVMNGVSTLVSSTVRSHRPTAFPSYPPSTFPMHSTTAPTDFVSTQQTFLSSFSNTILSSSFAGTSTTTITTTSSTVDYYYETGTLQIRQLTWFNESYLLTRLVLWSCIALVAIIDTMRHRREKPAGWQLHRAILVVLVVYILQEASTTAYVTINNGNSMYYFLIFMYTLARSVFLGLLLLISSGWKISRETLKNRRFFALPVIHFICAMTSELILDKYYGHSDETSQVLIFADPILQKVFIAANLGTVVTLLYSWWFIYACVANEMAILKRRIANRVGSANAVVPNEAFDEPTGHVDLASADDDEEEDEVLRFNIAVDEEDGVTFDGSHTETSSNVNSNSNNSIGGVDEFMGSMEDNIGNGLLMGDDSTGTHDYGMPDKAKLRMLKQYTVMVQLYVFIYLIVLVINAWNRDNPVWSIVLIDLLDLLIMSSLLFTFRLRLTNPYYILYETTNDEYADGSDNMGNIEFVNPLDGLEVQPRRVPRSVQYTIDSDNEQDEDEDNANVSQGLVQHPRYRNSVA
eukprot:m.119766 g.119766  ORF g.119766 m.119766 type:complete len:523 (+) comp28761_c0_seq2:82-1650(+)